MSNEYAFLKATRPPYSKSVSKSVKVKWYGLSMNAHADSGYIVDGQNFYVTADGTLRAADKPALFSSDYEGMPLAFTGMDGKLFYVYNRGNYNVDIVRFDGGGTVETVNLSNTKELGAAGRSLARYNVWAGGSDIVTGIYKPRLIIYPDAKWLSFNGEWNTAEDIKRYRIIKTASVKKVINQRTYNSGWEYNADGTYTVPEAPDGESDSIDIDTSEEVYGYADEKGNENLPGGYEEDGGEAISYYITEAMGSDGSVFNMLTVETVTTVTAASYKFSEDASSAVPAADLITPAGNRIFGVDGTKIFASAAGSYVNYDLDTSTDFDESNAWYSATQSGGDFTHICTYGGRVTAFKRDMLYELYNDKNPYRIKEISRIGAFNGRSVCEVNSALLYAHKDGIYAYGGSYPYCISEGVIDKAQLEHGMFKYGVAGTCAGKYFIREPFLWEGDEEVTDLVDGCDKPILVFDTESSAWSIINFFNNEVTYFAECDGKLYAALDNGKLYLMNTGSKAGVCWYFETPAITEGTADGKVLEKVQLTARFHTKGSIRVSVKYDNGEYEDIGYLEKDGGIHPLYCKLRKSDHIVRFIRFICEGDVEILTFEQGISAGGERYK